jgi:hypothetical protein
VADDRQKKKNAEEDRKKKTKEHRIAEKKSKEHRDRGEEEHGRRLREETLKLREKKNVKIEGEKAAEEVRWQGEKKVTTAIFLQRTIKNQFRRSNILVHIALEIGVRSLRVLQFFAFESRQYQKSSPNQLVNHQSRVTIEGVFWENRVQ